MVYPLGLVEDEHTAQKAVGSVSVFEQDPWVSATPTVGAVTCHCAHKTLFENTHSDFEGFRNALNDCLTNDDTRPIFNACQTAFMLKIMSRYIACFLKPQQN